MAATSPLEYVRSSIFDGKRLDINAIAHTHWVQHAWIWSIISSSYIYCTFLWNVEEVNIYPLGRSVWEVWWNGIHIIEYSSWRTIGAPILLEFFTLSLAYQSLRQLVYLDKMYELDSYILVITIYPL